ncbi:MAG: 3-methyl-2-oxobutanoate hydroxymethyltransferase [Bacteroidetes bacterium]|nr:3-methyl-2-oxobutanoate hydroxymethyltransferase [Bacteroidota bacterium]MCL5737150.1 3-methyl-2-oxobutanoate hydroxymethyltransferase [Bacteroidota bacterium]
MLGLTHDFKPRFVRHYANVGEKMHHAFVRYISGVRDLREDVKSGKFPSKEESC